MKTSELTGAALDWAVAKCEELEVYFENGLVCLVGQPFVTYWRYWNPSADWAQGGMIIQSQKITLEWTGENWCAYIRHDQEEFGNTPLIAAMRCFVASKLGDTVEIPQELQS